MGSTFRRVAAGVAVAAFAVLGSVAVAEVAHAAPKHLSGVKWTPSTAPKHLADGAVALGRTWS